MDRGRELVVGHDAVDDQAHSSAWRAGMRSPSSTISGACANRACAGISSDESSSATSPMLTNASST
jgi:hypothetical protein